MTAGLNAIDGIVSIGGEFIGGEGGASRPIFWGTAGGASRMYYAGAIAIETTNIGFTFGAGTAAGSLGVDGTNDLYLSHTTHGSPVLITAEDDVGTQQRLFWGDPDGTLQLGGQEWETRVKMDTLTFAVSAGGVLGLSISAGAIFAENVKSGVSQVGAGAVTDEVWKTASHATLPDNVLMIGV